MIGWNFKEDEKSELILALKSDHIMYKMKMMSQSVSELTEWRTAVIAIVAIRN